MKLWLIQTHTQEAIKLEKIKYDMPHAVFIMYVSIDRSYRGPQQITLHISQSLTVCSIHVYSIPSIPLRL